jgi:hypothetical protein
MKTLLKSKTVSFIAIFGILLFFTYGLPTNVVTGDWQLYSIWSVGRGWQQTVLAIFLAITLMFFAAQIYNEKRKGGGDE